MTAPAAATRKLRIRPEKVTNEKKLRKSKLQEWANDFELPELQCEIGQVLEPLIKTVLVAEVTSWLMDAFHENLCCFDGEPGQFVVFLNEDLIPGEVVAQFRLAQVMDSVVNSLDPEHMRAWRDALMKAAADLDREATAEEQRVKEEPAE